MPEDWSFKARFFPFFRVKYFCPSCIDDQNSIKNIDRKLENAFEWYERRTPLLHALVGTILPISGLFLSLIGGKIGAFGAILAYMAGYHSRHTQDPNAGNFLNPEKHPRSYFHRERDDN